MREEPATESEISIGKFEVAKQGSKHVCMIYISFLFTRSVLAFKNHYIY